MAGVESWVKQLVLVVFLVGVTELLLPQEGMRRYAHTALGLLLVLAVLVPFLDLLQRGIDWDAAFAHSLAGMERREGGTRLNGIQPLEGAREDEVRRLEETQRRLTVETYRQQVKAGVEAAARAVQGVGGATALVTVNEDSLSPRFGTITEVTVTVIPGVGDHAEGIVPVEPVEVPSSSTEEGRPTGVDALPPPPEPYGGARLVPGESRRLSEAVKAELMAEFGLRKDQVTVKIVEDWGGSTGR